MAEAASAGEALVEASVAVEEALADIITITDIEAVGSSDRAIITAAVVWEDFLECLLHRSFWSCLP